jgi:integrase
MQMAFIDGDLDANPCARLPKGYFAVGSKDAKAFEKADREKIFKALENSSIKFKTFCHIAMGSGARLGELMGLEWEDIDYDKNRIHIIRTSQHINGKPLITKEPKTKSSIRWIPLNSYVMELIKKLEIANKKQRLLLGNKWGGSNRLFVTAEGVTINPNTPSGEFHAFLDKIGVDTSEYSLHNCRHTYASMLIAKGTDIATVQKLMGHGSPRITLECYTHFFNEREDNTVEQLSEMYDCVQESK